MSDIGKTNFFWFFFRVLDFVDQILRQENFFILGKAIIYDLLPNQ